MPNGMDSGSANALARNKQNAAFKATLGPITFGISASSDMNNNELWNAGTGPAATTPGTYYPLTDVGQTTYASNAMPANATINTANQPYPGFEVDMECIGR